MIDGFALQVSLPYEEEESDGGSSGVAGSWKGEKCSVGGGFVVVACRQGWPARFGFILQKSTKATNKTK